MSAANVIINRAERCFLFVILLCSLVLTLGSAQGAVQKKADKDPGQDARFADIGDIGAPDILKKGGDNDRQDENAIEAPGDKITIKVVSILNRDENGDSVGMPISMGYDRDTDETYVISSRRRKVVVYGNNFFPSVSLGRGRGADAVRSVTIGRDGLIYLCQGAIDAVPSRISVYNQAFFKVKEWTFAGMPDGDNFTPSALAIGRDGNFYVTGINNTRGALVLNPDGTFSHWLRPMDMIFDQKAISAAKKDVENEEEAASSVEPEFNMDLMELPPELRPRTSSGKDYPDIVEPGLGPVQITDVKVDSQGNLFLLSGETSKIYVYNPAEEMLYSFGEKGGTTGKLSRPAGIAVDEKRKAVFVSDFMRHSILIYDMSGRFMYEFGGMGTGPGWFRYPARIALNGDDQLLVADRFNQRVQVIDVQFKYKFPLFQIPFVLDKSQDIYEPRPMKTTDIERYLGPGFESGQQVDVERVYTGRAGAI